MNIFDKTISILAILLVHGATMPAAKQPKPFRPADLLIKKSPAAKVVQEVPPAPATPKQAPTPATIVPAPAATAASSPPKIAPKLSSGDQTAQIIADLIAAKLTPDFVEYEQAIKKTDKALAGLEIMKTLLTQASTDKKSTITVLREIKTQLKDVRLSFNNSVAEIFQLYISDCYAPLVTNTISAKTPGRWFRWHKALTLQQPILDKMKADAQATKIIGTIMAKIEDSWNFYLTQFATNDDNTNVTLEYPAATATIRDWIMMTNNLKHKLHDDVLAAPAAAEPAPVDPTPDAPVSVAPTSAPEVELPAAAPAKTWSQTLSSKAEALRLQLQTLKKHGASIAQKLAATHPAGPADMHVLQELLQENTELKEALQENCAQLQEEVEQERHNIVQLLEKEKLR